MRKGLWRAAVALLVLLIGAQAFQVERTNPPVVQDADGPPDVRGLLRRACYDCHSHETVWPWYSRVAPVSWLVAHDVHDGRHELDFSTWNAYPPARKAKKLKKIANEVTEGEMPPWSYVLMHGDARLSAAERETLRAWTVAETARPAR